MTRFRSHVLILTLAPLLLGQALPGTHELPAAELARLFDEDQSDRQGGVRGDALSRRDSERRSRVDQLLTEDLIVAPADRYHAAMIYQHSPQAEDILKAHALASAAAFDGHREARWLVAASLDRFLTYRKERQFFGTQFERDETGRWMPGWTAPAVTESLRQAFGLKPPEALKQRAESFN